MRSIRIVQRLPSFCHYSLTGRQEKSLKQPPRRDYQKDDPYHITQYSHSAPPISLSPSPRPRPSWLGLPSQISIIFPLCCNVCYYIPQNKRIYMAFPMIRSMHPKNTVLAGCLSFAVVNNGLRGIKCFFVIYHFPPAAPSHIYQQCGRKVLLVSLHAPGPLLDPVSQFLHLVVRLYGKGLHCGMEA